MDVGIHFLVFETTRAEVDNFDLGASGMGEKDVFRFQVAMYDFLTFQQHQAVKELFGEATYEFQREAPEVMTLDKFVEIHAQKLS